MPLNNEHIDYIIKDLHHRGVVYEPLRDELIDHICTAVEKEIEAGKNFIEAYRHVLLSFGHTDGLQRTQKQTWTLENSKTKIMIKNYLTIAFRNLRKHSFYTSINVIGLAVGVAACLIISLFVYNELSYDKHNKNAERIYRINSEIIFGDNHYVLAVAPPTMAAALESEFPDVEIAGRFRSWGTWLVKRETENIKENHVIYADNNILKIFTIPFLQGNPQNALAEPNTMVISKSLADKFFPNETALGQTLILDNKDSYKITGVYEDLPQTSHFHYNIMLSMAGLEEAKANVWLSNNFNTYFILREGVDPKQFEAKLTSLIKKYVGPEIQYVLGPEATLESFQDAGNKLEYTIQPLLDIHLHSDRTGELEANGDITYVYLFAAVALFILAIACVNFMNLSTARSSNRAREVGVRKVMGSLRSHLIRQFLIESAMLSIFSFIVAIAIAYLVLPLFNQLADKQLFIPISSPGFIALLLISALLVGLLAGLYPSFFLSAFKPVNVLKGNVALGMKSGLVRSSLVVFQFTISIILIIATITVQRQLSFIQNKKIGFDKNQVISIHDSYALGDQLQSFKDEVTRSALVSSGTISGFLPIANSNRSDQTYWPEGVQPTQDNLVGLQTWQVDYDYVKTLGMNILEGRNFSRDFPSDSGAVILNEAAARMFGYDENPLGRKVNTFGPGEDVNSADPNVTLSYNVIGIVENFHFESLRQNITPLALFLGKSSSRISFRFESKDAQSVIQMIENNWKRIAPGQPFQYSFLDEDFNRMYSTEQRLGEIFALFSGLAIIIACLGLFALTSFTAEQRTKEIGVRKVLGASVSSIVILLSKEFGRLIIIGFVLAAPVAWFAINWWLKSYTYKVEIGVMVYLAAGAFAFFVAWITMGYQSIKAASSNPIKALRSE